MTKGYYAAALDEVRRLRGSDGTADVPEPAVDLETPDGQGDEAAEPTGPFSRLHTRYAVGADGELIDTGTGGFSLQNLRARFAGLSPQTLLPIVAIGALLLAGALIVMTLRGGDRPQTVETQQAVPTAAVHAPIVPTAVPAPVDPREVFANPVTAYASPDGAVLGPIEAGRRINGQIARYGTTWVSLDVDGSGRPWIKVSEYGKPLQDGLPDYGPKPEQLAAQPAPVIVPAWSPQVVEEQPVEQSTIDNPAQMVPEGSRVVRGPNGAYVQVNDSDVVRSTSGAQVKVP